jgi:hypothetical protein
MIFSLVNFGVLVANGGKQHSVMILATTFVNILIEAQRLERKHLACRPFRAKQENGRVPRIHSS